MKLKKILTLALAAVLAGTALASCAAKGFDKDGAITVISREKGSGTRSAFIELFGVEVDKEDKTVETADITDKTNVMMTSVSQNANAIGYISLGSLNDSVKALKIDGAAATVENIENGSYKISRPFNIATRKRALRGRRGFHRLRPFRRGTKGRKGQRLHSRQDQRRIQRLEAVRQNQHRRLVLGDAGYGKAEGSL